MSPVITTKSKFWIPYKAFMKHIFIDQLSFYTGKSDSYVLADLGFAKAIGVTYVILTGADLGSSVWGVDKHSALDGLKRVVDLIKEVGFKVAIPSAIWGRYLMEGEYSTFIHTGYQDSQQDMGNWAIDTQYFLPKLAELNPDGWYIDFELQTSDPGYIVGYEASVQAHSNVINAMMTQKPGDLWISPYWMAGGNGWQKQNWDKFLKRIPKAPAPFMSVSALQDRIGALGINPGSPDYIKVLLPKLKWHKMVCEINGWLAQVNVELFGGYGGVDPTWDRVKAQLDGEARSDIVSGQFVIGRNICVGPCWEYAGSLSPQKSEVNKVLYDEYLEYLKK